MKVKKVGRLLARHPELQRRGVERSVLSSPGHPEGEHGSGADPRRERHQTEEPVGELPEDERASGRGGSQGPDGRHHEPGALRLDDSGGFI